MISISNIQLYTESDTIEHVKSLAYNRGATTTGETEALYYIENALMEEDIKSKVEHFDWIGPMRILMRMSYVFILSYLILFRLFLVIIAYFLIKNFFERTRNLTLVNKEESKNIFTKILSKNQTKNRPLVIFTAHYDSISLNLPYKIQVILFFIYRLIILFYILVIITFSTLFILDFLNIVPLSNLIIVLIIFTTIIGVFISIPILFLVFSESPSSGSIDNASGVAILIELAKLFKKNPLNNMDLLFIWTGAEEWGMKGSRNFCRNHFESLMDDYDLDRSYYINIDMVGSYIGLLNKTGFIIRREINQDLNKNFEATAKKLKIPLIKFNKIIKPNSDNRMFKRYARRKRTKLQISCFHSDKDSKFIHSLKDTPDKCSIENLNGCLNICSQSLRSIDLILEKL
ncbi:MAG: M28 family metallopeptidase [Candidatus Hodarchaeota archaeon]